MTSKWGNREQEPDPPAGAPAVELVFFTMGSVAFTITLVVTLFESATDARIPQGAYAILASFMAIGILGWEVAWLVARVETRFCNEVREHAVRLRSEQAELTGAVASLATKVDSLIRPVESKVAYLPPVQRAGSHLYVGNAAVGGGAPMRTGLDADTIANARKIARRLLLEPDPNDVRGERK